MAGEPVNVLAAGGDVANLRSLEVVLEDLGPKLRIDGRARCPRLQTLAALGDLLACESDPRAFVPSVCEELMRRLALDAAAVHLVQPDDGSMRAAWRRNFDPSPCIEAPWIECVRRRRAPIILHEIQRSEGPIAELWRSSGLQAVVLLPLVVDRRCLGVIAVGSRSRPAVSDDEIAVLHVAAHQLAIALDRAQRVEQLEQRAAELRAADRRREEFLAMLAHELRNPLAPIVNAVGLLRRRAPGDDDLRSIAAAERQALHLSRLVDDLLDAARITEGKIVLRRERIDLRTVIDQALETVAPLIESRRQRLEVCLPGGEVTVDADAARLAQIVANLLHNAARYTDEAGHVALRCAVDGETLRIEVADDGIGIRADMLDPIFDCFVQVDPTSDRARGGLGLGLTLVRRLAELHGGTVAVRSEGPGRGSTFEVRLPIVVCEAARQPTAIAEACAKREGGARRILLVEDNEDIRITLRELLEFEGHEVSEAADGPAGAALIVERRPNVALVDIGLPGIDGFEVAQRVRSSPGGSDTRLVALTGYGGDDVARRARDAGFDAHLIKPVQIEELFRILGELG